MLKPLTLSLSLAIALSVSSVSKAGGLFHNDGGCSTCGLASPQGPVVSPQGPIASPQGECIPTTCEKPKCNLFSGLGHKLNCGFDNLSCGFKDLCGKLKPKPKCYTYEWVLKKKRVWGHHNDCGSPACETCAVYPSGQGAPSPQGYVSPQSYSSPQAGYSSPQAYGTGQIAAAAPVGTYAPAPVANDEAPPAPEAAPPAPVVPAAPAVPAPPAPPAPGATSGLLFSTPSGN